MTRNEIAAQIATALRAKLLPVAPGYAAMLASVTGTPSMVRVGHEISAIEYHRFNDTGYTSRPVVLHAVSILVGLSGATKAEMEDSLAAVRA